MAVLIRHPVTQRPCHKAEGATPPRLDPEKPDLREAGFTAEPPTRDRPVKDRPDPPSPNPASLNHIRIKGDKRERATAISELCEPSPRCTRTQPNIQKINQFRNFLNSGQAFCVSGTGQCPGSKRDGDGTFVLANLVLWGMGAWHSKPTAVGWGGWGGGRETERKITFPVGNIPCDGWVWLGHTRYEWTQRQLSIYNG